MLHELLCHLLDGKNMQTLLDLIDSEDFIHPGDQEIIKQIVSIGSDYRLLHDAQHQMSSKCCVYPDSDLNLTGNTTPNQSQMDTTFSDIKPGLYLKAFSNGVDGVLDTYREEVVRLEEVIMQNPQLSMSYILSRAMKFEPLFALLKNMLQMIKLQKVHGCLLVGWLHSYNNYGTEYIVQTANKIEGAVNVIFYKQLANWLICGDLVDEYNEFFIEQSPDYSSDCTATSATCTLTPAHSDTSKTITNKQQSGTSVVNQNDTKDPMKRYRLRLGNLPDVIPLQVAEDILFTGQMVWIIREHDSTIDVWQTKSLELIHRIQHLSSTFHLPLFTSTVTTCKSLVSAHLWSIITPTPTLDNTTNTSQSLHQHLRLIRDYYCMGRGELFQQYVLAVHEMQMAADSGDCQSPLTGTGDIETRWQSRRLDRLFHETARRLYGDGDKSHERFTVIAAGEMQFQASWPLDILVFSQQTLLQYTRLFQFLLRIQRTQSHLHQLWLCQHRARNHKYRTTSSASSIAGSHSEYLCSGTSCWSLRHNLQFVVDNLQYYLHVDVIESQFAQFEHSLDGAGCTSDITSLHSKFLSGLLSRTFVLGTLTNAGTDQCDGGDKSNRMVYNIICHLLDLCNEFCSVTMVEGPLDSDVLTPYQDRFHTMMEMLLRKLYSLHEKVSSGYHVLQLLHRLDFNRWYTKTLSASDLNLTKLRI